MDATLQEANFQYRQNYDCQSDKVIKNYHLEIPINGQNMIVQQMWFIYWNHPENDNIKQDEHQKKNNDNLTCSPMNGLNNPSYKWNRVCVHHSAAVKIYQDNITMKWCTDVCRNNGTKQIPSKLLHYANIGSWQYPVATWGQPQYKDVVLPVYLIFNMGILIPGEDGLYIETGPWYLHSRYAGR